MESTEVIIIGGGFSGIAAGKLLHEKQISFKILEARDRVGGRVYTKRFENDFYLDFGGQWIGPSQTRMYELVQEFGLEPFTTYNQGKNILDINQKVKTYKGLIPNTDIFSLLNMEFVMRKLQGLANKIDVEKPHLHPKAKELDELTLEDFLVKNCFTKNARKILSAGLETVFACELSEISLLHAIFYIKSGNGLESLLSIDNGAQQDRIVGGMQLLAEKMLEAFKAQLLLNQPVKKIEKVEEGYVVSTPDKQYKAKYIISAIPPHLLSEIDLPSNFSETKQELIKSLPMGLVAKCFAVYNKPFWRENGYSGQSVSDKNTPFQTVFDASPKDGSKGVLLAFCIANRHKEFFALSENERKRKCLEVFSTYFGETALKPEFYIDYSMKDDVWSGGCYAAFHPPKILTTYQGSLSKPEGDFHFAGTETSTIWCGYIEGAVRAGERAAKEIFQKIN